ncbi:hypothetical protein AALO_G00144820 [Alosa alosa]|uniref:Rho-GAP domain-containing protein n=1 Tax=Alosa alosa TaxID=278164 RepID=A0AAV6GNV8_9TELE|nr:hypothetical protein AALO_G00144820 [Alosa alosa]
MKLKEFLEGRNLITKLQAKHDLIQKTLGERVKDERSDCRNGRRSSSVRKQDSSQMIPLMVESCIRFISRHGLHHEGIFRVSGSQVEVNDIKNAFERCTARSCRFAHSTTSQENQDLLDSRCYPDSGSGNSHLRDFDYCNALLTGLPACAVKPLQMIQSGGAWSITNPKGHMLPGCSSQLHWLPMAARVKFKALAACLQSEDPLAGDQNDHDMDSIAGVLKLYFRGLEHALFPKEVFHDLISCVSMESLQDRAVHIHKVLVQLPSNTLVIMRYLFAFLNHLSQYSEDNMMDPYNLAICFGPTLMSVPECQDQVSSQAHVNELIKTIIIHPRMYLASDLQGPSHDPWRAPEVLVRLHSGPCPPPP